MSDLATNTPPSTRPKTRADRRRRAIDELIVVLSQLFPRTFVAQKWEQHVPLKVGTGDELIDQGILAPGECARTLGRYTARRSYQAALAVGGQRIDLDGNPAGEVSAAQQQAAKAAIARRDALAIEQVEAGKAAMKAARAAERAASHPPEQKLSSLADLKREADAIARMNALAMEKAASAKAAPPEKPLQAKPPPALQLVPAPEAGPKRLGLADLKRAAQARREHTGQPDPPRAA
jgi:ProP effector